MKQLLRLTRFKVHLHGENFLISCDGEHRKFGFHAARIIAASDIDSARKIAIIRVHQELNSAWKIIESADVPRVTVTEIQGLPRLQWVRKRLVDGFEFYPEEDSKAPASEDDSE